MEFHGQKSAPYLADILHQHGVEHVVICPGSRNAPLTLAFARHGKFKCISIVDERSAAYFALGMAKASGKPVVIISTSGTAPLNFAPAVAEGFYQQVPLIIFTADRPEAWIDQQDGQAIHQRSIYANFITRSYSLRGELYHKDDLWMTERITNEVFHLAKSHSRPVHVNISFSEPLYNEDYSQLTGRKIELHLPQSSSIDWKNILNDKKNILVVLGQMDYNPTLIMSIQQMFENRSVVFVSENLSNVFADGMIGNISELQGLYTENMRPDIMVYLGGPVVSKQSKKFLSQLRIPVVRIQQHDEEVDTFQNNVALMKHSPVEAMGALAEYLNERSPSSDFFQSWLDASEKAIKKRNAYLAGLGFCDLKVFEFIAGHLPENAVLHLGNSTPVRYAQLFNDVYPEGCIFYSNRGTSGIDGSTSTAAGFSYVSKRVNFLITGDLSFQYDANAFFNHHVGGNLKVIIINNSGGNIFRIIDGPRDQMERETFFETGIQHEFSNLARHFNLNYFSARNEIELGSEWKNFIKSEQRPSVLEVFTDAEISAKAFIQLYKKLQA